MTLDHRPRHSRPPLPARRADGEPEGAPHRGWWLGPGLSLLLLTLIGLIVWLIIRLRRPAAPDPTHQARQVLVDRYAKGELSTDEYTERLEHL